MVSACIINVLDPTDNQGQHCRTVRQRLCHASVGCKCIMMSWAAVPLSTVVMLLMNCQVTHGLCSIFVAAKAWCRGKGSQACSGVTRLQRRCHVNRSLSRLSAASYSVIAICCLDELE
jgi:hypothetical protein